jgi:hypothetical protein
LPQSNIRKYRLLWNVHSALEAALQRTAANFI